TVEDVLRCIETNLLRGRVLHEILELIDREVGESDESHARTLDNCLSVLLHILQASAMSMTNCRTSKRPALASLTVLLDHSAANNRHRLGDRRAPLCRHNRTVVVLGRGRSHVHYFVRNVNLRNLERHALRCIRYVVNIPLSVLPVPMPLDSGL